MLGIETVQRRGKLLSYRELASAWETLALMYRMRVGGEE
jgi:hypothetical protein